MRKKRLAYLSVSYFSYTLRLVWSRMTLTLMKQPRSSFFDRNMDIVGETARTWLRRLLS